MTRVKVNRGCTGSQTRTAWIILTWCLTLLALCTYCDGAVCGDQKGPDLAAWRNETDTGDVMHETYLDLSGNINCNGAIKAWEFVWIVSGLASCHDVMFQVWRPVGGSSYMLIGQTPFSPNATQCQPITTAIPTTTNAPTTTMAPTTTVAPTTTIVTTTVDVTATDYTGTELWSFADSTSTAPPTTQTTAPPTTVTTTEPPTTTTTYPWPEIELVRIQLFKADYIPIQPGDMYGWRDIDAFSRERRLPFESASSGSGAFSQVKILSAPGVMTVGGVTDWSPAVSSVRNYSLNIIMAERDPPYIINLPADTSVTLAENSPVGGVVVFTVKAMNGYNYGEVVSPDLVFNMTSDSCNAFTIDPVTGDVTTNALLDFEALTPPHECTLVFTVHEGQLVSPLGTLVVIILDVNEPHTINSLPDLIGPLDVTTLNAPWEYLVTLTDEDDPVGKPWKTFTIVYSKPTNSPFIITSEPPATPPVPPAVDSYGRITVDPAVIMSLWQGASSFTLGITASDGQHSHGPLELIIELTNIRSPPLITNLPATVDVMESETGPAALYNVSGKAMPDPSRTDMVMFAIRAVYPKYASQSIFNIDPTTGRVTYVANPGFDYFGINPYYIEVVAAYNITVVPAGVPAQISDPENLTVTIDWVNQSPYFKHPSYNNTITVQVPESQLIGSVLPGVLLDATDRDILIGDWIYYSLSGNGSHLFSPSNITHRVYVIQPLTLPINVLNYTHTLDLHVIDSHGAFTNTTLAVTVTDVNDHTPITDATDYYGSVKADTNAPLYTSVTIVTTDDDSPPNANLAYTVMEYAANTYFEVNPGGMVMTKQPIPYSAYKTFIFTVHITDRGSPVPLNTSVQVYISMDEKNINSPEFYPDFFSVDLRSDTGIGVLVYTVFAYDNDSIAVNNVTYFLWSIPDYYALETTSGKVSVMRRLLAYRKELLYIYAQDNHSPSPHVAEKPFTLRIDTYEAKATLVDIYLHIPLADFLATQAAFLAAMNDLIPYWDIRIESARNNKDNTIVTIYAVDNPESDLQTNQHMTKIFINEGELIDLLSKNLKGDPSDTLRGPEFATWQPYKVQPRYPVWITDTEAGVAVLCLICLLALAGLITMLVLLSKRYRWGCYKSNKPPKPLKRNKVGPVEDEFNLNYMNNGDIPPVYTTGVPLAPPVYPFSSNAPPPPAKLSTSGPQRASIGENDDANYIMPPVSVDDNGRPLPRQRGGQAA